MSTEAANKANRLHSNPGRRKYRRAGHLRLVYSRDWVQSAEPVPAGSRNWGILLVFLAALGSVVVPALFWLSASF
jgi:hypothetical protein